MSLALTTTHENSSFRRSIGRVCETHFLHLYRTSPFYLPLLREQNPSATILKFGPWSQRDVCEEFVAAECPRCHCFPMHPLILQR
jgi:hypothetical protein